MCEVIFKENNKYAVFINPLTVRTFKNFDRFYSRIDDTSSL
jgi:hypothetical protein